MYQQNAVTKIRKRNNRIVAFDQNKITQAILKALRRVRDEDSVLAEELSDAVVEAVNRKFDSSKKKNIPSVEEIQDIVVSALSERGYEDVVRIYQEYRSKRAQIREAKYWLLYRDVKTKLSDNALKVMESRYLRKNEEGKIIETPEELFRRIAHNIAGAEKVYYPQITDDELFRVEEAFYRMLAQMEFLPNSPTLMNAGNALQQLSACFVLPVDDSLASIFGSLRDAAIIHQSGGGTGFDFSHVRPRGDFVKTTTGIASGPISFMKIYDVATEQIKQGSFRRGANMGILRVDHPDILEFITAKEDGKILSNFNISVAVTDEFMLALKNNTTYAIRNPRTGQVTKETSAEDVFNQIVSLAWRTGDPGLIFIDRMNDERGNPVPSMGRIEATNPCGEVPMLAYESCNLGSINLNSILDHTDTGYEINWNKFMVLIRDAVHFLDNVIEMGQYPLPEIEQMSRGMRRIGLGLMGWADILMKLAIPYNSQEAFDLAGKVMEFIQREAEFASDELAKVRGTFPHFSQSVFNAGGKRRPRNAALTTIAPTGTISIIADCSSGIEPIFALAYVRKSRLNSKAASDQAEWVDLVEVNGVFEEIAKREGFWSEELMRKIAEQGSVQHIDEVPGKWRKVFVVAHDLIPEDHVKMQAAFQKHVDNAVSKTINFPASATVDDVKNAYMAAWDLGCKGITVYRDGSNGFQVLNVGVNGKRETAAIINPEIHVEQNIDEVVVSEVRKEPVIVSVNQGSACMTCD